MFSSHDCECCKTSWAAVRVWVSVRPRKPGDALLIWLSIIDLQRINIIFFLFCRSSDMSGASNTLAREFLTDVHQLCSAVAQRAEAREEDEEESHMVALGEYLVRGRGFLLLSTLDSIIDQVRLLDSDKVSY